ncbi:hypothetical protein DFJ58DRAFT_736501 [Suillus subalutaceus]|uniref:uncharacterized protein n=1 Tax=Suillus subalutaceus TaxID=48586 RepID=UPI001B863152|nr:uncharacterized protein DFJ58DRAFT_736501 [Suillus subalutaceus]KAG1831923.1 hypothetical protein DFJ58DRAFT_736501 [Suillus subalutaceus]
MRWRQEYTNKIINELKTTDGIPEVYEDVLHGKQYLDVCQSGKIKDSDAVLMFSIDRAQLYESKQSNCWIYIWVIFDHAPDERYKKNLHHLRAIQTEGLPIWDSAKKILFRSNPFFFIATADSPSMAFLTGLVVTMADSHAVSIADSRGGTNQVHRLTILPYVNLKHVIHCSNMAEYELACLKTGITKPSIFCGSDTDRILLVPLCFGSDIMHIAAINTGDLLLPLWRGTFRAETMDDKSVWAWAVLMKATWKAHGSLIADATPFLPGSFDRPPHNPAEKISSGYKA